MISQIEYSVKILSATREQMKQARQQMLVSMPSALYMLKQKERDIKRFKKIVSNRNKKLKRLYKEFNEQEDQLDESKCRVAALKNTVIHQNAKVSVLKKITKELRTSLHNKIYESCNSGLYFGPEFDVKTFRRVLMWTYTHSKTVCRRPTANEKMSLPHFKRQDEAGHAPETFRIMLTNDKIKIDFSDFQDVLDDDASNASADTHQQATCTSTFAQTEHPIICETRSAKSTIIYLNWRICMISNVAYLPYILIVIVFILFVS